MIAVITATSFEIPILRKRLKRFQSRNQTYWLGQINNQPILSFICGIGDNLNGIHLLHQYSIQKIILVGFSAALQSDLSLNEAYQIDRVYSQDQKAIDITQKPNVISLTSNQIADNSLKGKLKNEFPQCQLLDMETYHIAKLSQQNAWEFISLRAIYDQINESIPFYLQNCIHSSGNLHLLGLFQSLPSMLLNHKILLKFWRRSKLCNNLLYKELCTIL